MSDESGLLDNPNLEEEIEQQKQVTLEDIKDDTAAIRDAIYHFGGAEIEQAKNLEKSTRQQSKQLAQENKEIIEAIKKGIVLDSKALKALEKVRTTEGVTPVKMGKEHSRAHLSEKKYSNAIAETAKSELITKPMGLPQDKKTEQLPNGWQSDKNGRVRDKSGKYVSEKELEKYQITSPRKKDDETKSDVRERRILDALNGIQDKIGSIENIDPVVNATQELLIPLTAIMGTGKVSTEMVGRGLGKLTSNDNQENKDRKRWFRFGRKKEKEQAKREVKTNNWLQRIFKKREGGGLLAGLLSAITFLPRLIIGALGGLGTVIGGVLEKLFLSKLAKNVTEGIGRGAIGGSNTSGSRGTGKNVGRKLKGIAKKIPLLGTALALWDIGGALNDNTVDEKGQSNRAKGIGAGTGALAGGVIGGLLGGPVGALVGATLGDIVGEKIGGWLSTVNWQAVGDDITNTWNNTTQWFSENWNNHILPAWKNTAKWFSDGWNSLKDNLSTSWDNALDNLKKGWGSAKNWLIDLAPNWTKSGVQSLVDGISPPIYHVKEYITQASSWAKDKTRQARDWIQEKSSKVVSFIADFFSSENDHTVEEKSAKTHSEEYKKTTIETTLEKSENLHEQTEINTRHIGEAQTDTHGYLSNILLALNDIWAWLKERFSSSESILIPPINEYGMPVSAASNKSSIKPEMSVLAQTLMGELDKTGWSEIEKNHFMSQIAHETGDLKWTEELADGSSYEGRRDLGNTQVGDGKRFKGRGLLHTTGRANYQALAAHLNRPDIMQDPSIVARDPQLAVQSAIFWWNNKKKSSEKFRNAVNDPYSVETISRGVNGGTNGLQDRIAKYNDYTAGRGAIQKYAKADNVSTIVVQHASLPQIAQSPYPKEMHIPIPTVKSINQIDYSKMHKTIEREINRSTSTSFQGQSQVVSRGGDPIYLHLTQDVSERTIAHIVTGGLSRPKT